MNEPKSARELGDAVEALVRGYVASVRSSVLSGVERGCSTTLASEGSDVRRRTGAQSALAGTPARTRKISPKRSPESLAKLANDLYERIVASPGEPMAKFAKELNCTALELQVPITMLKKGKRIRTTGERRQTRYFPVPT